MKTTLAERLTEAMKGPPKVSGVDLARSCGITPTSVSDWKKGKTKTIEGNNLLAAARKLGVRPDWLASGVGPKYAEGHGLQTSLMVSETVVPYKVTKNVPDRWTIEAIAILKNLKPSQREGAVTALRVYVSQLGPPRDGQTLSMAVKKEGVA